MLLTNSNIYADDTCLFSLVVDQVHSKNFLNSYLERISDPDHAKQAVEFCFSKKLVVDFHVVTFKGTEIPCPFRLNSIG